MPTRRKLLDKLVAARFRGSKEIRNIIKEIMAQKPKPKRKDIVWSGVHRGQFFRIHIPAKKADKIPKLRAPMSPPKPIEQIAQSQSKYQWFKDNFPTLLLNFGSICSFVGFTRSDVLELRGLSVVGSACAIYYNAFPIRWTPLLWSSLFTVVNSYKMFEIYEERQGTVDLDAVQEERYTQYFMPYGVTPKQFEQIYRAATVEHLKKSDVLVRQGEELDRVQLVVEGTTRASVLGRFLTAASAVPVHSVPEKGPSVSPGAWIGEMALLEKLWNEEDNSHVKHAMYTIVAQEDGVTVLSWSFAEMNALMNKSPDMQASLTRAMTAAVVGKVVRFTHSRSRKRTLWEELVYGRTHEPAIPSAPPLISTKEPEHDDVMDLPQYPLKSFK